MTRGTLRTRVLYAIAALLVIGAAALSVRLSELPPAGLQLELEVIGGAIVYAVANIPLRTSSYGERPAVQQGLAICNLLVAGVALFPVAHCFTDFMPLTFAAFAMV